MKQFGPVDPNNSNGASDSGNGGINEDGNLKGGNAVSNSNVVEEIVEKKQQPKKHFNLFTALKTKFKNGFASVTGNNNYEKANIAKEFGCLVDAWESECKKVFLETIPLFGIGDQAIELINKNKEVGFDLCKRLDEKQKELEQLRNKNKNKDKDKNKSQEISIEEQNLLSAINFLIAKVKHVTIFEIRQGALFIGLIKEIVGSTPLKDFTEEQYKLLENLSVEITETFKTSALVVDKNEAIKGIRYNLDDVIYHHLVTFIADTIDASKAIKAISKLQLTVEEVNKLKKSFEAAGNVQLIVNDVVEKFKLDVKKIFDPQTTKITSKLHKDRIKKVCVEKIEIIRVEIMNLFYLQNKSKADNLKDKIKNFTEKTNKELGEAINEMKSVEIKNEEELKKYSEKMRKLKTKYDEYKESKSLMIQLLKDITPPNTVITSSNADEQNMLLRGQLEIELEHISKILKDIDDAESIKKNTKEKISDFTIRYKGHKGKVNDIQNDIKKEEKSPQQLSTNKQFTKGLLSKNEPAVPINEVIVSIRNGFIIPLLELYKNISEEIKNSVFLPKKNELFKKLLKNHQLISDVDLSLKQFSEFVINNAVVVKAGDGVRIFNKYIGPEIQKVIEGKVSSVGNLDKVLNVIVNAMVEDKYKKKLKEVLKDDKVNISEIVNSIITPFEKEHDFKGWLIQQSKIDFTKRVKAKLIVLTIRHFRRKYLNDVSKLTHNEKYKNGLKKIISDFDKTISEMLENKLISLKNKVIVLDNFKNSIVNGLINNAVKDIKEKSIFLLSLKNNVVDIDEIIKHASNCKIKLTNVGEEFIGEQNEQLKSTIETIGKYENLIKKIKEIDEKINKCGCVQNIDLEINIVTEEIKELQKNPLCENFLDVLNNIIDRLNKRANTYSSVEKNVEIIKKIFESNVSEENNKDSSSGNNDDGEKDNKNINKNDLFLQIKNIDEIIVKHNENSLKDLKDLNLNNFSQEEIENIKNKIAEEENNIINKKCIKFFNEIFGKNNESLVEMNFFFIKEKYNKYFNKLDENDGIKNISHVLVMNVTELKNFFEKHGITKNDEDVNKNKILYIGKFYEYSALFITNEIEKIYGKKEVSIENAEKFKSKLDEINQNFFGNKNEILAEKSKFLYNVICSFNGIKEINSEIGKKIDFNDFNASIQNKCNAYKKKTNISNKINETPESREIVYSNYFDKFKRDIDDLDKNEKAQIYQEMGDYFSYARGIGVVVDPVKIDEKTGKGSGNDVTIIRDFDKKISERAEDICKKLDVVFNQVEKEELNKIKSEINKIKEFALNKVYDELFNDNKQFYDERLFCITKNEIDGLKNSENEKLDSELQRYSKKTLNQIQLDKKIVKKYNEYIDVQFKLIAEMMGNIKELEKMTVYSQDKKLELDKEQNNLDKLQREFDEYVSENKEAAELAYEEQKKLESDYDRYTKKTYCKAKQLLEEKFKNLHNKYIKNKINAIKTSEENLKKLLGDKIAVGNNEVSDNKIIDANNGSKDCKNKDVKENKEASSNENNEGNKVDNFDNKKTNDLDRTKKISEIGKKRIEERLKTCEKACEEILLTEMLPDDKVNDILQQKDSKNKVSTLESMIDGINDYDKNKLEQYVDENNKIKIYEKRNKIAREIEIVKKRIAANEKLEMVKGESKNIAKIWCCTVETSLVKIGELNKYGKANKVNFENKEITDDYATAEDICDILNNHLNNDLSPEKIQKLSLVEINSMAKTQEKLQRILAKKWVLWIELVICFAMDASFSAIVLPYTFLIRNPIKFTVRTAINAWNYFIHNHDDGKEDKKNKNIDKNVDKNDILSLKDKRNILENPLEFVLSLLFVKIAIKEPYKQLVLWKLNENLENQVGQVKNVKDKYTKVQKEIRKLHSEGINPNDQQIEMQKKLKVSKHKHKSEIKKSEKKEQQENKIEKNEKIKDIKNIDETNMIELKDNQNEQKENKENKENFVPKQ